MARVIVNTINKNQVVFVKDLQNEGVAGTSIPNAYAARPLNTLENPESYSWVSLATDQITLTAGTYIVEAIVMGGNNGTANIFTKVKLRNITDSTDDILSIASMANNPLSEGEAARIPVSMSGMVAIASTKVFEIQARNTSGNTSNTATSFGHQELYTNVKITKVT